MKMGGNILLTHSLNIWVGELFHRSDNKGLTEVIWRIKIVRESSLCSLVNAWMSHCSYKSVLIYGEKKTLYFYCTDSSAIFTLYLIMSQSRLIRYSQMDWESKLPAQKKIDQLIYNVRLFNVVHFYASRTLLPILKL